MNVLGGFRARGRTKAVEEEIIENAIAAAEAGSFAVVVEGTSVDIAEKVTRAVPIPTIGIGASAGCDGQILVTPDMLGLFDRVPKFVKKFADMKGLIEGAARDYAAQVKTRSFPGEDNTYKFTKK
jgi:3-methyl-2-oxobutanoate hydroxymethyltransferase